MHLHHVGIDLRHLNCLADQLVKAGALFIHQCSQVLAPGFVQAV